MTKLTTHVLDTSAGVPAAGVKIFLQKDGQCLAQTCTNQDGRCDHPLLENFASGTYELMFMIGEYFDARGIDSPFLREIIIRCDLTAGQSYHVPLLTSPWAYSTYRGS
ncbi:MAG: hydroxyisourate hydrolase [Verrucomicrobia bacterium]|nr:MAG: hydroxyisourate hydrolase [Verrucomicrobiota bacterium]